MSHERRLRGAGIGAGYFSQFQYEAWSRMPEVHIAALANRSREHAEALMAQYGIPRFYADYAEMIDAERPDFVDIITPPETHLAMCRHAAQRGVHIICQKPLAPTYAESVDIVRIAQQAGVRFMVHENFRWQPWHREIKRILRSDLLGHANTLYFRLRTGDGWGPDAYLARQPFFRDYPRLFVYETGVHFIDTFRFLLGEIETVFARLRRLNPVIKGEDSAQIVFGFEGGATAILDANRYNETECRNPRYTFGELRLDGSQGHLTLDLDGNLHIKLLGQPAYQHSYAHEDRGFAGDCVYPLQRYFVDCLLEARDLEENTGADYLRTMKIMEACYESARTGQVISMAGWEVPGAPAPAMPLIPPAAG